MHHMGHHPRQHDLLLRGDDCRCLVPSGCGHCRGHHHHHHHHSEKLPCRAWREEKEHPKISGWFPPDCNGLRHEDL